MNERLSNAQEVRNVDHAFEPEMRAAQNDWDEYLNSRPFQDAKGSLHSADNGQFMSNPNNETQDEYYNRMLESTGTEGQFAGAGLREIAEMVRQAKASGDRTLEADARAAFDDKFVHLAEKYDWQGVIENADGTVTDRNAIADQKLAYYESIMNEEARKQSEDASEYEGKHRADESDEDESQVPSADFKSETDADNEDGLNERARSAADKFDELSGAEQAQSRPTFSQKLKKFLRDDQFAKSQLPQHKREKGDRSIDERAAVALREFDELERSVGQHRAGNWYNRALDAFNGKLTKFYYGVGRTYNEHISGKSKKDGETDQEYEARMTRNGKIALGIAAVGVALFASYKLQQGMDSGSNGQTHGGSLGSTLDLLPVDPDPSPPTPDTIPHDILTSSAWDIPTGSGGESLMDRLGADKSVWYQHQDEFLKQFPQEAYRMADGNVGFDDPGKLSNKAIEFWAKKTGQW